MLDFDKISDYYRDGGRILQFYISDEEMEVILLDKLDQNTSSYSLVVSHWDGKDMFEHKEYPLDSFMDLRKKGIYNFHLKMNTIHSDLDIPHTAPIKGNVLHHDYLKYYLYSGLIEIRHGSLFEKKYFDESTVSLIDKYYIMSNPDEIFTNLHSLAVYKILQKEIRKVMVYKSAKPRKDGTVYTSRTKNVSRYFGELVKQGKIVTNINVIE